METMERNARRARRSFTPEFKSEIVERCHVGDRSIPAVCRDFDLTESTVRRWIEQAEIDAGERPGLSSDERQELAALRRENKRLQADVDLLKRATAFFVRETRGSWTPSSRRRKSLVTASSVAVICSVSPGPPTTSAAAVP